MILSAPNIGDSRSQIAWRRSISFCSGATAAGSNGSGAWSEKAVTRVFPLALGNTSTVTTAPLSSIIEEERLRRHVCAGVVYEARTSLPEHRRQRHPFGGERANARRRLPSTSAVQTHCRTGT